MRCGWVAILVHRQPLPCHQTGSLKLSRAAAVSHTHICFSPFFAPCHFAAGLLAAVEQIAFADRILLNKTDLVSEEEKTDIRTRIKVPPSRHSVQAVRYM